MNKKWKWKIVQLSRFVPDVDLDKTPTEVR